MDETTIRDAKMFFIDKSYSRQVVAEQNRKMNFVSNPKVTPEEAQDAVEQSLRENGLKSEDNIFSCGIIAARGD